MVEQFTVDRDTWEFIIPPHPVDATEQEYDAIMRRAVSKVVCNGRSEHPAAYTKIPEDAITEYVYVSITAITAGHLLGFAKMIAAEIDRFICEGKSASAVSIAPPHEIISYAIDLPKNLNHFSYSK